jgi:hypothetical protein
LGDANVVPRIGNRRSDCPISGKLGRPKYPLANFYSGDQSPVTVRRVQWKFSNTMIGSKEEPNIVGGCHLDRNIDDLIQHAVFGSKLSTPGPKSFGVMSDIIQ